MRRVWYSGTCALIAVTLVASCVAPREPIPITPAGEAPGAAVVRRPLAEPTAIPPVAPAVPPTVRAAPTSPSQSTPAASGALPADTQYVCVTEVDGVRRQTAIEFAPRVAQLCRRHAEMGPCQYERDLCRRSGGRVYTANGVEITRQTEAEYDRKVMRVRFRAQ